MRAVIKAILLIVFSINILSAISCVLPRESSYLEPEELVVTSDRIVLAQATGISFTSKRYEYEFKVLKELKGGEDAADSVTISFDLEGLTKDEIKNYFFNRTAYDEKLENDFELHSRSEFWETGEGRAAVTPWCSVQTFFKEKSIYLLILSKEFSVKSFELIKSDEDKWYKYIKKKLNLTYH